jgi:hypothetical protein
MRWNLSMLRDTFKVGEQVGGIGIKSLILTIVEFEGLNT